MKQGELVNSFMLNAKSHVANIDIETCIVSIWHVSEKERKPSPI